jgi:peptidoglycan/LPS O-acetylase OafA/YrhL
MPTANEPKPADVTILASNYPRVRLHFLDGLRGLAAFYVMLSHTVGQVQEGLIATGRPVSLLFRILRVPLEWGGDGVAVFIVLSGFCLMLPIVRSDNGKLLGGLGGFLKRRSVRILPPYYAAVGLGVGWAVLDEISNLHAVPSITEILPGAGMSAGILLSHLFLVHDFSPKWIETIEGPLWSIAVEWHIYFIFALVLLPLWKRFGIATAASLAVIVGFGPLICFRYPYNAAWAEPYMLTLFAMGMIAALICFSNSERYTRLRNQIPWTKLFVGMLVFTYIVVGLLLRRRPYDVIMIPLVGLTAAIMIVSCVEHLRPDASTKRNFVLDLLESRWAIALGTFSYSLYLIHGLIVVHVKALMEHANVSLPIYYIGTIVLCIGLSLLGAYVFYLLIEKPCTRIKEEKFE